MSVGGSCVLTTQFVPYGVPAAALKSAQIVPFALRGILGVPGRVQTMTVYKLSELKLRPYILTTPEKGDTHNWQGGEGNEVLWVQWQKLHDNPEAWGCSFVRNDYRSVSAIVNRRLLPDYAPKSQLEKKKRETWVWLASVSVTDDKETQTLADGYYFFNVKKAQGYCETAALMICHQLGITFPGAGAGILADQDGYPITRHCRVVLADGSSVVASDFEWYEFYLESTNRDFKHSPLGYMQVRPQVKYLDANHNWKSAPCCEVKVTEI